jgi:hypothetical protein
MGDVECKFISFIERDSKSFEIIEISSEMYHQEAEQHKKDQVTIKEVIKKDYVKSDSIWSQINEIPAHEIATDIRGVVLVDR